MINAAEESTRYTGHAAQYNAGKKDDDNGFPKKRVEGTVGSHKTAPCRGHCNAQRKSNGVYRMQIDPHIGTGHRVVGSGLDSLAYQCLVQQKNSAAMRHREMQQAIGLSAIYEDVTDGKCCHRIRLIDDAGSS